MAQLMSIKKNVDVQPGVGVPAIFHCSQGDKGTRIILGLLNNNDTYAIPEGTTAIIRGSRADGTLFTEITADIDTTTEIKFNLTEDMTSVAGPVECEAVMTSGTANIIGTANFIIDVEKSPASIGSVFPGTDAATTWLIDKLENEPINELNGESVVDAINSGSGSGLTEDIKVALLACFEKVAWIDEDGQDYYDALYNALYPPADLVSISAVYTQSGTVYDTDTLDSLKPDLVVTAHFSDSTTQTINNYTLSGTLTEGTTSIITVSYSGKTTTFNVVVSAGALYPLENGTHTFTTNSRVLTVSHGSEFLYEAPNASSSTTAKGAYLNISKVSANDTSATEWSNIGNTDSDTPLFTIPANATVRLEATNISIENLGLSTSTNNKWTLTLRGHQGTTKLSVVAIPDSLPTETQDTYAETVTAATTDVTCLYGYFRNPYKTFSATIHLYVNGELWI